MVRDVSKQWARNDLFPKLFSKNIINEGSRIRSIKPCGKCNQRIKCVGIHIISTNSIVGV